MKLEIAKIRKFLMQWVFPPSWIRIVCFLLSRIVRCSSSILQYKRKSHRFYVLGNGPSLKKDIEKYRSDMKSADILAVNFMGTTFEYDSVRPSCYVLADPAFFADPSTLPESSRNKVLALQEVFINKTTWPMTLVTLGNQSNSIFVKELKCNPNITVLDTFNNVPVPLDIRDFYGWSKNRYSPPAQNVINMALYLSIVWRYSEVILLGADTSFHTQIHVDQKTNRLYRDDEHYYGVERRYMYQDCEQKIPETMSVFLHDFHEVFAWYEKLREFADWAGVKIINASYFSWIDAFDRPAKS